MWVAPGIVPRTTRSRQYQTLGFGKLVRIDRLVNQCYGVGPGQRPSPSTFIWPFSKDTIAQVKFSGGAVRAAHLDRLAKYLELAKLALEAEEKE
jgi:hypothetical protein